MQFTYRPVDSDVVKVWDFEPLRITYAEVEAIVAYIDAEGTIEGAPALTRIGGKRLKRIGDDHLREIHGEAVRDEQTAGLPVGRRLPVVVTIDPLTLQGRKEHSRLNGPAVDGDGVERAIGSFEPSPAAAREFGQRERRQSGGHAGRR